MIAVLLVVVTTDRPRPTTLLWPRSNGKPEVATAVDKLLMMGMRMPETCWAVFKWQAINLRDWCIWLVYLFECMMMHGLTNPKYGTLLLWVMHRGRPQKKSCKGCGQMQMIVTQEFTSLTVIEVAGYSVVFKYIKIKIAMYKYFLPWAYCILKIM